MSWGPLGWTLKQGGAAAKMTVSPSLGALADAGDSVASAGKAAGNALSGAPGHEWLWGAGGHAPSAGGALAPGAPLSHVPGGHAAAGAIKGGTAVAHGGWGVLSSVLGLGWKGLVIAGAGVLAAGLLVGRLLARFSPTAIARRFAMRSRSRQIAQAGRPRSRGAHRREPVMIVKGGGGLVNKTVKIVVLLLLFVMLTPYTLEQLVNDGRRIMPGSYTAGGIVQPASSSCGTVERGGYIRLASDAGTALHRAVVGTINPAEWASAFASAGRSVGHFLGAFKMGAETGATPAPVAATLAPAQQVATSCCPTTATQPTSGTLGHDPVPHPVPSDTTALIVSLAKGLGYDLTVTSTFREGGTSYHAKSEAVDFSDGTDTPGEMGLDKAWAAHYGTETAELIHAGGVNIKDGKDVGDGMGLYGAQTMSEHHNHVHIALSPESVARAAGGVVPASRSVTGAVHADRAVEASQAAAAAQAAGFSSGELVTAVAVKLAESHGWDQVNSIGAAGGWQILRSAHPEFAAQWADGSWSQPSVNATMAYSVWKAAGSWRPWTTFTGADTPGHVATYAAYLPDAQAAVAGVGVTPVSSTCTPTGAVPASYVAG